MEFPKRILSKDVSNWSINQLPLNCLNVDFTEQNTDQSIHKSIKGHSRAEKAFILKEMF